MTTDYDSVDYFTDPSLVPDPHPYFDYLRAKNPVSCPINNGVLAVTSWEAANAVYKNSENYSSCVAVAGPFTPMPFVPEGDDICAQLEEHRTEIPMFEHIVTMDPPNHTHARSLLRGVANGSLGHLSGARHRRHGRRRRYSTRGCTRIAPDVDQRRHGHLRARWLGDRGDDGHRHGDGPPRAVLPHAVGGHIPAVNEGRQDVPARGARTSSWQMPFGATSAAHTLALNAQRHFDRYGTTRETLGWIALNQRANAALNPTAIYRDPMTMDDYLNARMITTPFGLYDCDVPCDGAIAVIVSAVDVAKDMPKRPVLFEAVGTQIVERTDWDQTTMTHEPQVLGQSAHLWTRTSLRPKDVDVAELYDGFSFNCLSWLEALGFCGIGEAKDFLDGGKAIARDGVIPLNTHGGQLSHGRTHGMGLIHEAVTQLRGEAGERQVEDARVAVVSSGGLTPSGAILLRTDG
jgi:hypothetical protein